MYLQRRRQSLASECPGSSRAKLQDPKQDSEASDEDMLGDYMQNLAAHNSGDDTDDQVICLGAECLTCTALYVAASQERQCGAVMEGAL